MWARLVKLWTSEPAKNIKFWHWLLYAALPWRVNVIPPPHPTLALLVLFDWARNIQILGAQGATGSHSNHMRRITTCEALEQSVQGAGAILRNSTQSPDLHWMCLGAFRLSARGHGICLVFFSIIPTEGKQLPTKKKTAKSETTL